MASMLTCEICLEKKSDRKPKCLNCLHSFCRDCLASWVGTRQISGDIECPVCRQLTNMPSNGIDGLVDDFKVLQLEEMIKAIGDPFVCQGCLLKGQSSRAKSKCVTCDRRLCEACYQHHLGQKIFVKHKVVTDLCEVHGNAITHVCVTCFTILCVDCIISGIHDNHDLHEVEEGIGKLRESVEKKQKQLNGLRVQIKQCMKTTTKTSETTIELNITRLKHSAFTMKQEIDRQVAEVIKRYRERAMTDLRDSLGTFEQQYLPKSLKELGMKSVEKENIEKILDLNTELNKKIRHIRDAEQHVPETSEILGIHEDTLSDVGKPLSLKQYYNKIKATRFDALTKGALLKLDSTKMVFEKLSEKCKEIGLPNSIEIMNDFTAVVAFEGRDHADHFDEKGSLITSYACNVSGSGKAIHTLSICHCNVTMFCMDQSLIKYSLGSKTEMKLKGNVGTIFWFICNPFNNTFIFSQKSSGGKVYRVRESDMIPQECSLAPGNIRVFPYAGSYRIVVASRERNTVLVYDEDENLLYTLKGCGDGDSFNFPTDTALLGHDNLLVADADNHRICQFKLSDGSFDGLLLTQADGIKFPYLTACKYPYIWIAGRWQRDGTSYGSLQLYKYLNVSL